MPYIDFSYFNDAFNPIYSDKGDFNTNAKSYYDALARNKLFLKLFTEKIIKLNNEQQEEFEKWKKEIEQYGVILDEKLKNFDKTVYELTEKWLDENLHDIITEKIKTVWFGLTDDGYFMAVIPESWDEIRFDTNNDGHLILEY